MYKELQIQSITLTKLLDLMGRDDYDPGKIKFRWKNTVGIDTECSRKLDDTIEDIKEALFDLFNTDHNFNLINMLTKNFVSKVFALEVICVNFEVLLFMQYDEECEIECIEDGDFIDDSDEC